MLRPGHLKNMYGLFITNNRLQQYSVSKYYLRFLIKKKHLTTFRTVRQAIHSACECHWNRV